MIAKILATGGLIAMIVIGAELMRPALICARCKAEQTRFRWLLGRSDMCEACGETLDDASSRD